MPNTNDKVIEGLNGVLADSMVLYQKLRTFHWYVSGRMFFSLHEKFEELYDHWAEVIDEIAERILAAQGRPIPTLAGMVEHSSLKESDGKLDAKAMVKSLHDDMEAIADRMVKVIGAAEKADDRPTANLLDGYNDQIRKSLWMLRAWMSE